MDDSRTDVRASKAVVVDNHVHVHADSLLGAIKEARSGVLARTDYGRLWVAFTVTELVDVVFWRTHGVMQSPPVTLASFAVRLALCAVLYLALPGFTRVRRLDWLLLLPLTWALIFAADAVVCGSSLGEALQDIRPSIGDLIDYGCAVLWLML